MAQSLGAVARDLRFEYDDSGRFDEVPTYIAEKDGARFTLFGTPEGELEDAYVLEFSYDTPRSIAELRDSFLVFGGKFFVDKEVNGRGYFDYSIELAERLRQLGFESCKAV